MEKKIKWTEIGKNLTKNNPSFFTFNPAEIVEINGSNSGLFEIGRTEHL